jgi:hypothetical protein
MDPRYKSPTAAVVDHEADDEFRDLGNFTNVLVWMLRIGAGLALLSLWSSWMQLELLSGTFTSAEGEINDKREAMIGGAAGIVTLVTFFIFGRWIVLAHRNLPALGAQYLEYRPGWAVGWFFIPIGNLWKPYQAMRSLWRSSRSVNQPEIQESTWVLPTWWTFWLISSTLGNATFRMQMRAKTVDEFTTLTQISLVSCAIDFVLCLVASVLVSRIWQAQARQRENPEPAPSGFADAPAGG